MIKKNEVEIHMNYFQLYKKQLSNQETIIFSALSKNFAMKQSFNRLTVLFASVNNLAEFQPYLTRKSANLYLLMK